MRKPLFLLALLLPLLAPSRARALELLLEENRGESGTIGYVDIDRVFKEYSGTTGAREDFLNEIKKKEDALDKKKIDVFTLKAEISKLRQERAFALTLPSLMATQRSLEQAAKTEAAERAALTASTQPAAAATAASTVPLSTGAVSPSVASLPGLSTAPVGASAGTIPSAGAGRAGLSAPAAAAPPRPSTGTAAPPQAAQGLDLPGISKIPLSSFKFSVSTSVPVIDAAIAQKETDLASRETELQNDQKLAEKELLNYENHRSELLLGRIYVALKELAIKEEVSVVVDKRNILYGQKAVDLTDKLIEKLEKGGI